MLSVQSGEQLSLPDPGEINAGKSVFLHERSFALWNDTVLRSPQIQVDMDDRLADIIDHFPQAAVVRIWSNTPCLVVSRRDTKSPDFPAAARELQQADFAVVVRRTGGTAVVHTSGVLNFTLCYRLPAGGAFSVAESYAVMNAPIMQFLESLGIPSSVGEVSNAYCPGRYDIVAGGNKLAGTAQRVKVDARGRIVLSHLSLNVSNSPRETEDVIRTFYRACGRHDDIEEGLTTSVNSLLPIGRAFGSAHCLATELRNYLQKHMQIQQQNDRQNRPG